MGELAMDLYVRSAQVLGQRLYWIVLLWFLVVILESECGLPAIHISKQHALVMGRVGPQTI